MFAGRALAAFLLLGFVASCAGRSRTEDAERVTPRTVEEVLAAHNDSLMALPGVVGTAIGLCDGAPCIRVFLTDSSETVRKAIPLRLDGYPVKAEVTGPFRPR